MDAPHPTTDPCSVALKNERSISEHDLQREKLKLQVSVLDSIVANFDDSPRKKRKALCSSEEAKAALAPVGLEQAYNDLYSLLQPCLSQNRNVAALVMGKRGTGKTLLVEHTLRALEHTCNHFRIVRLNGLVVRGDDVGHAVKEIIRQLSDIAMAESSDNNNILSPRRERKQQDLLRLRQSSFTSNLALLDEVLRMASVDRIPILIVLDEFDALLGSSSGLDTTTNATTDVGVADRQLLLYHLLDRVTTQGTSLCLVAITSHLAAVSMLEKRVKSRAEGASKVIIVNPYPNYETLVDILLSKFQGSNAGELKSAVSNIIGKESEGTLVDEKERRIQHIFERNYRLGKDLRWFCRVVLCAVSLYREDCQSMLRKERIQSIQLPTLTQDHFLRALVSMNAPFANETPLHIVDNVAVDPRMQALFDLSGPQVAIVLSARRILARDAYTEDTAVKPLSLQRIMQEYQNYRGPHRYSDKLLRKCFVQLLETDVLRPSADHTGGGPLQYSYIQSYFAMDDATLSRMPLHLFVDIDRELGEALKNDWLECSTSLREWGRKKN